ncbi:hypothetical protein ACHAXR_005054 [Thalassiosira sp. AJA248-18]
MQHDPARTEVPIFLTACGRRDDANERFATGLDVLHGSLNQSTEGLVEVVTTLLAARAEKLYEFEVNLKNDYEYNEKTRANMNAKLEESARVAQGLFANLLMRVAQPHDAAGGDDAASSALGALGAAGNSGNANGANANNNGSGNEGKGEEEEPDWDAIMKHEPARTEVPTFLAARGRREAACSRFEFAIEEFQTTVDGYAQELTQTMADLYNSRTVKLDEYDQILKHDYVENDKMRAKMQSNLTESATAAHNMFEELMTRVMQPGSHQQHQQQPSASVGMLTQATTLGDSP